MEEFSKSIVHLQNCLQSALKERDVARAKLNDIKLILASDETWPLNAINQIWEIVSD